MGIDVDSSSESLRYSVHIKETRRSSSNHPLSSSGRKEWGTLLEAARVENGNRLWVPGAGHPPIFYRPAEWIWEHGKDNKDTIVRALRLSGMQVTSADFSKDNN
jgi:hypothetical protein